MDNQENLIPGFGPADDLPAPHGKQPRVERANAEEAQLRTPGGPMPAPHIDSRAGQPSPTAGIYPHGQPVPYRDGEPGPSMPQGPLPPPPFVMYPYGYPPPNTGMSTGSKFALGCGIAVAVFLVLAVLALAAIPLVTNNARDARRAEGEQMMGSMKSQARATYARSGDYSVIKTLTGEVHPAGTGCGASEFELYGKYYNLEDELVTSAEDCMITAYPVTASDGVGTLTFTWAGGDGEFRWP